MVDHVMSRLQDVISGVSDSFGRSVLWMSSEALVVRLQALCRGFMLRQQLEARRHYLITQTPAVVTIQVRAHLAVGRACGGPGVMVTVTVCLFRLTGGGLSSRRCSDRGWSFST